MEGKRIGKLLGSFINGDVYDPKKENSFGV
jgi:hypothetical protein